MASSTNYLKKLGKTSNNGEKGENLWNVKDVVSFAEKKLNIKLDDWQRDYIKTEGNTVVRAGRQSGKSFAEALRVALFALKNGNTQTLVIGAVERQSFELFEKIKNHILILAKGQIKGRPTMHKIELKNKSKIISEPVGRTGYGLRSYTINKLVADEAHYIPEEVWPSVRPMLATTNGTIDLLSTPRGNAGFFYDAFFSDEFKSFHVSSEDCKRISKEFLKSEKKKMTRLQYAQEYKAEFLDKLQQFFPLDLINSCTQNTLSGVSKPFSSFSSRENNGFECYMGVDVARYGGDENAFVIVRLINKENVQMLDYTTTEKISTADTIGRIISLDKAYGFRKIYIDDGGIGGAVLDVLLERSNLKRRVVGINNASRPIVVDKNRGKKILKEDLYGNLKRMMEQKEISLPKDDRLKQSLLSIQFEYNDQGNVKIWGRYSHITEGLIRAAWCVKTKGLRLYVH